MDLDQLRLFVSVAAAGSFSRAALLLGTTQSAVSKRILALEQELRCPLFERTGRGARLTEAGRLLAPRAEALAREADTLPELINETLRQPRGLVRVALQPSIAWPLAGRIHARVSRDYPGIRLQIQEGVMGQVEEWLREGRADLGVVTRLPNGRRMPGPLLFEPELHLVSAPGDRATRRATVAFASLLDLPLIIATLPNAGRVLIEEAARRVGRTPRIVLEANSIHVIKHLVAEGRGYTATLAPVIAGELKAGTLAASRIVRPVLRQTFLLAFGTPDRPTTATRVVADIIREASRTLL
ncbi:MAG: LysR family transcriptional regulator [Alphaproteobacteria bacterium]|nr:LysR family transcriptional regulator [Alphaproteobacteria bacterium]